MGSWDSEGSWGKHLAIDGDISWRYFMDSKWITLWLCQQFAIENDPVEIVDFPIENGGSFHRFLLTFTRPGILKVDEG
jgi:hypothetical protein